MEFLALAAGLIVIGVSIVLLRHRRPRGLNAGIDDFAARRDALAPTGPDRPGPQGQEGTWRGDAPRARGRGTG